MVSSERMKLGSDALLDNLDFLVGQPVEVVDNLSPTFYPSGAPQAHRTSQKRGQNGAH